MSVDELESWNLRSPKEGGASGENEKARDDHFSERLEKDRWQRRSGARFEPPVDHLRREERDFIRKVKKRHQGEGFVTVDLSSKQTVAVADSWSGLNEILKRVDYDPHQSLTLRCYE